MTTFGGAKHASFEMTKEPLCYLREVQLGPAMNLANWCTIMAVIRISPEIIVGSLILATPTTVSDYGIVPLLFAVPHWHPLL